ncbi:AP-2 complex subunit mu [Thraustotheca clavata]|uniref:AP-2 complex subunit mu n=1 Tax=Thraustotheca clavata TaxID=74557 RepID=A0A1W0A021_9STRA|nr:AP-2 complex subunit mu [Thraustotheca clavata]
MALNSRRQEKCRRHYTKNAAVYLELLLRNTLDSDLSTDSYAQGINYTIFNTMMSLPGGPELIKHIFSHQWVSLDEEEEYWTYYGLTEWQTQVTNYFQQGLVNTITVVNALGIEQRVTTFSLPKSFRGLALWSTVVAYAGFWNDLWECEALNATLILGVDNSSDIDKANWEYNMDAIAVVTPVSSIIHQYLGPLASMDLFIVPKSSVLLESLRLFDKTLQTALENSNFEQLYALIPSIATLYPAPKHWIMKDVVYYTGSPMCYTTPPQTIIQQPMGFYDSCTTPEQLSVIIDRQSALFAMKMMNFQSESFLHEIANLCNPNSLEILKAVYNASKQLEFTQINTSAIATAAVKINASLYQFAGYPNNSNSFLLQQPLVDSMGTAPWTFFGYVFLYDWLLSRREIFSLQGDIGSMVLIGHRDEPLKLVANSLELPHQACTYIWYIIVYCSVVQSFVTILAVVFAWFQRNTVCPKDLFHANRVIGYVWIGRPFLLFRGFTALILLCTSSVHFQSDQSLPGFNSGFKLAPRSVLETMVVAGEATWITYVLIDIGLPFSSKNTRIETIAPLSALLSWGVLAFIDLYSPYLATIDVEYNCMHEQLGLRGSCIAGKVSFGSLPRLLLLVLLNVCSIPIAIAIDYLHWYIFPSPTKTLITNPHVLIPACANAFLSKVCIEDWYNDIMTSILSGMLPLGWKLQYRLDFKLWRLMEFDKNQAKDFFVNPSLAPSARLLSTSTLTLSMRRFRLRAFLGFAYVVFSVSGSYSYIYVSQIAMANDLFWGTFNSTGYQTFLTNWFNTQLQLNTDYHTQINIASKEYSDNSCKYNGTTTLASAPLAVYASTIQHEVNTLPQVIKGLRQMDPCALAWISTSYCYVDFNKTWEMAPTTAKQLKCTENINNGAIYLESIVRNILDWTQWQLCYGSTLNISVLDAISTTFNGQKWIQTALQSSKGSISDEIDYWQNSGIEKFETEWQNYKTLGVIETFSIQNAFGISYQMTLKALNGSMHNNRQSTFKMHWVLANDLYNANSSIVRGTTNYRYTNISMDSFLMINRTIDSPLNAGLAILKNIVGPFGSISMKRVAVPNYLKRWYQSFCQEFLTLVTKNDSNAWAFSSIQAIVSSSPIPITLLNTDLYGGDVTCPSAVSPSRPHMLEFFTGSGACVQTVSDSLSITSIMFTASTIASGISTTMDMKAVCTIEMLNIAGCMASFNDIVDFIHQTIPPTIVKAFYNNAQAIKAQFQASIPLVLLQYADINGLQLAQNPLFSSQSFEFYAWNFLLEWIQGVREVVAFSGDIGSITTISGRNALSTQPVNAMEVPINVAYYFRCVLIYITAVLGCVATLVCLYILTARGYIEGANMFNVNRVAGLVWIGRPLLLLRGMTAVCILSTASLELRRIQSFYYFISVQPSWFMTIMATGEITWLVFILNDSFSLFTKQYTALYGMKGSLAVWATLAISTYALPAEHTVTINRQCSVVAVDYQLVCQSGSIAIGSFQRFCILIGLTIAIISIVYIIQRLRFPSLKPSSTHSFLLYSTAKHHYIAAGWLFNDIYFLDPASAAVAEMISGLFLISQKGEVVLNRLYRDDVSRRAADAFRLQVIAAKETGSVAPIKSIDGCSFLYTRHENLYLVAVSRANINIALVFQFLSNLNGIFQDYMGKKYNEESIRNNFTLVYELLDETMDYGYPQNCSSDVLKMYINLGSMSADASVSTAQPGQLTSQITGAIDWRREGIKYKRNEVYLDVFESVNLLMSSNGAVLRNEVVGQVVMKTMLTGMPECKLGLNDKLTMQKGDAPAKAAGQKRAQKEVEIDDCTFHRCVRLGKFDADRTITFVPPDGEFELMKYRVTENINLPFKIMPAYQEGSSTRMAIAATFSARLFATNLVIKIPVPQNTARCKITVPIGTAKHAPEHHAIVWKIRKFQGTLERMLDAEVEIMKGTKEKAWSRPPIQVEFQVPMFTASGLHVRFLKVFEKSSYQTTKWVRYVTRAGQYQLRI